MRHWMKDKVNNKCRNIYYTTKMCKDIDDIDFIINQIVIMSAGKTVKIYNWLIICH